MMVFVGDCNKILGSPKFSIDWFSAFSMLSMCSKRYSIGIGKQFDCAP